MSKSKPIKSELENLISNRQLARAALFLGAAASLAANVLHAEDHLVSRVISAWPPIALIITVEIITRIQAKSGWMSAIRIIATTVVASIAAWVSYWHMAGVAAKYGETPVSSHMIPFSVDGLIVVASISLVEVNRRLAIVLAMRAPEIDAEELEIEPEVITPEEQLEAPTPRSGRRTSARGNHAACDHANTREARQRCRDERAAALTFQPS